MTIFRIFFGSIVLALLVVAFLATKRSASVPSVNILDNLKSTWTNKWFRAGLLFIIFHFNMSLIGTYPFGKNFYNNIFLSTDFQVLLIGIILGISFFDENKKAKSGIHRTSTWIVMFSVINLGLYSYYSYNPKKDPLDKAPASAPELSKDQESLPKRAGKAVSEFFMGVNQHKIKEMKFYKGRWSPVIQLNQNMTFDFNLSKKVRILVDGQREIEYIPGGSKLRIPLKGSIQFKVHESEDVSEMVVSYYPR